MAVKNKLYLDACDAWCTTLLVGGGLINSNTRRLAPLLMAAKNWPAISGSS